VKPGHVYVHIPFCARRCSYCDFAIAVRREVPVAEYLRALRLEIGARFPEPAEETVQTVYLGGGTPSLLGPAGVARLLDVLRATWSATPDAEITIEANPEDVEAGAVREWRTAGITRVSLGVQSFDDRALAWMHRSHNARRVREAAEALREGGIDNWSLDLIFALPESLHRDWRADLEQAIRLNPAHVSCYGLTLEPHTQFDRWRARGEVRETDEDSFAREFLDADDMLGEAGYEHYEVSNYARSGFEARHNAAYWERVPYLGLGPSAHSFDGVTRRWNEREYAAWHRRVANHEDPIAGHEVLSSGQEAVERAYLGLRTVRGVRIGPADRRITDPWVEEGWARTDNCRIYLTVQGWLRLDALAPALTDSRSRY
jgi:oxygen-independent coproporphyrinogen-3 oxidase